MKLLWRRNIFFSPVEIALISVIDVWNLARTVGLQRHAGAAPARRYEPFSVFCSEHLLEWLGIITSSSPYTRRMWVVLIVVFYLSYRLQFARQISPPPLPRYIKASCCCSLRSTLTALIALWLGNTHTVHWLRTVQGCCSFCLFNEYGTFSLNM